MTDRIRVSFACNDERGMFAGECASVEFDDFDGDNAVTVESSAPASFEWLKLEGRVDGVHLKASMTGGPVSSVSIQVDGHDTWVGNWCWDACSMALDDARALLTWLLGHGYQLSEWSLEGPFADLAQKAVSHG